MSAWTWLAVVLVSGLGAVARFLVNGTLSRGVGRQLPLGTFAINISGSFVLGLLAGLALTGNVLLVAGTATIGSYTTFSTWMLETEGLREDSRLVAAAANVILSLLVGLGAVSLGRLIGGQL
jgi:CrcB protein